MQALRQIGAPPNLPLGVEFNNLNPDMILRVASHTVTPMATILACREPGPSFRRRSLASCARYYCPGLLHSSNVEGVLASRNFVSRQLSCSSYVALTRANVRMVTNRNCSTGRSQTGHSVVLRDLGRLEAGKHAGQAARLQQTSAKDDLSLRPCGFGALERRPATPLEFQIRLICAASVGGSTRAIT